MRMVDMIREKRDGAEHAPGIIKEMVGEYVQNKVPDYQMAAWLMSVYFRGLSAREQSELTLAMAYSGDTLNLSAVPGIKVDKHSTGGVGDKVTLLLAPLVAAAGLPVVKMSGRGLGHTGGTIDKLESIPGFKTALSMDELIDQAKTIGLVLAGQTGHLVPGDKKLYALRDVTGTVESIPLIAASVMSKKIAAGADAIVLDVKVGNGAFVHTIAEAEALAGSMVAIGKETGRKTIAVLTDMDQPLGYAIGNSLEVLEVVKALHGECPEDLARICLVLGSHMLVLGGLCQTLPQAEKMLQEVWQSEKALHKFQALVSLQGGPSDFCERPEIYLSEAKFKMEVRSLSGGYIGGIDTLGLGLITGRLGAGRAKTEDKIAPEVGIICRKKVGEKVSAGETLCLIHAQNETDALAAKDQAVQAFRITASPPPLQVLIKKVVD